MLKVFDYFDCKTTDFKQPVFQDEYFRTRNCSWKPVLRWIFQNKDKLSPENTCKICDKENLKFNTEVHSKKASSIKPAHLNASAKFTERDKVNFKAEKVVSVVNNWKTKYQQ